ncbi:hypothetical protein PR202_gb17463 [Eleusine coracana subsp. coracana]|uniref:RRM domain-containing protein n=1 Tax=Eleusine coracana subsp. coracana TaxID=191504 RepID=A0AAV5F2Z4_ELECO|nr:hypothetical protein PR202_gb17463 [Eleusine coracana subsp. coracana]
MAAPAPPSSSTSGSPGGGGPPRPYRSRFGDTTLTKVFVGGLAWETPSEGLRQHFERYGEILEAVVIADRITGRSKGYGFVTFREAEAAQRAVQDPSPMIAGRRANCNIASQGPPRHAQLRGKRPPPIVATHKEVSLSLPESASLAVFVYGVSLVKPNPNHGFTVLD